MSGLHPSLFGVKNIDIRSTCTKDIYVKGTYANCIYIENTYTRDIYIETICTKDFYVKNTYLWNMYSIRIVFIDSIRVVKFLKIYLQLF